MRNGTRSANVEPVRRTGRKAPKLTIVADPRPITGFDFSGMLAWEGDVYGADPLGGDPSLRY